MNYTVQSSRDLQAWGTLTTSLVSATPMAQMPGFETVVFQTDATVNQEQSQFVRLAVSLQ